MKKKLKYLLFCLCSFAFVGQVKADYPAVLSGGVTYDKPVYQGRMTSDGDGNAICGYYDGVHVTIGNECGLFGYISSKNFPGAKPVYQGRMTSDGDGNAICGYYDGVAATIGNECGLLGYIAKNSGTYGQTYTCPSGGTLSGSTCITPVNGSCNPTTNGQTFTSKPSSDLCTTGQATPVTGSGPWTWSCLGSNGGSLDNCSAQVASPPPIYTCNNICSATYSYTQKSFQSYNSTCADGTEIGGVAVYTTNCSCGAKAADPFGSNLYCSAPIANLSATPTSIAKGSFSTLQWSASNATSCTSSDFNTNNATSGSISVSPQSTKTYSLSCANSSGTNANASATINVTCTPNWSSFSCVHTPADCASAGCGQAAQSTGLCNATDSNNCGQLPTQQDCRDHGVQCSNTQVQCQACVSAGNWKEVAP